MLLATSDDQGRGLAEADAVKWYVCPNVPEITIEDVPLLLAEMAEQKMIVLYDCERGGLVYQVARWWEYQQLQWARPSKYDPLDNWTDRIRYSNRGAYHQNEGWDMTGGFDAEPRDKGKQEPPGADDPELGRKPPRTDDAEPPRLPIQPNPIQLNSTEGERSAPADPFQHPIVQEYRKQTNVTPSLEGAELLTQTFGGVPTAIADLDNVLAFWKERRWGLTNVAGICDRYTRGDYPGGDGNRPTGPPGQATGPPIVITGLDETPEWLRG